MTITRITLIAAALALSAAAAHSAPKQEQQQQAGQQQLSPKVGKALRAAQELMQKEDWDGAYAQIQEARAVTDKQPFDDFQIAEMLGYVELKREKFAEASAAFQQSIASGLLPQAEVTSRLKLVTQLSLQLKDYPRAAQLAAQAIASTADAEPELFALRGQAQYLSGDYQAAAASMAEAVQKARKLGKPVQETWLQVQLSAHAQLKDSPGVFVVLKQLAPAFPKKEYLQDLFNHWKRVDGDDRNLLNLYRLMFELNLLEFPEDYLKLAELASQMGLPGEAISVLERGQADKKFTDDVELTRANRHIAAAKAAMAVDRKTLAALEQSTQPKTGEDDVQLGMALASYGQYQKASEALQSGIAKGGVKRPDQAQLLLGQVLLKLGKPTEAQAAFEKVPESEPLGVMARLWRAYTTQPAPLAS